jgi:hypothetical protein
MVVVVVFNIAQHTSAVVGQQGGGHIEGEHVQYGTVIDYT